MSARTVHVLSQYLWPDDAPTGLYSEQLADALRAAGVSTRLVGGEGRYREGHRTPPATPIARVPHYEGRRGSHLSVAREYGSVRFAFASYIRTEVAPRDVVVVNSAPPTTLFLHKSIRKRGAVDVYWLQDYYPQLIRGVFDPPAVVRAALGRFWRSELGKWTHVVKAAGNLGYSGANAIVIRNWNTMDLGAAQPALPRTALYSGNLGYGHHLPSFLALCSELRDKGYTVTVRGDGPGMSRLPDWIRREPPLVDPADLARSYWQAEVHLVAGHPNLPDAVFPSKFWNALVTGRPVLASGFAGVMAQELESARHTDVGRHLPAWRDHVLGILAASDAKVVSA